MSDIFISYAKKDRERARPIAEALEQHGWSVWWDPHIPPGKTFDEVIEEALDDTKCVVVLWSNSSIKSRWVKTEADEGLQRHALVPVFIEHVAIPLAFKRIQAADLTDWKGDKSHQGFTSLLNAISEIVGDPSVSQLAEEEEQKRAVEEAERKAIDEEKRSKEDASRKVEEVAKRKTEEDESRRVDEAKRKTEEEQQRAEETGNEKKEMPSEVKISSRSYVPWLIGGVAIVIFAGIGLQERGLIKGIYTPPIVEKMPVPEVTQPFTNKAPSVQKVSGKTWKEPYTEMEFVRISGGSYGIVDDFYMGIYEVTQKQWQKVMGDNPSCDVCPVDNVSWHDVQEFIKKLNAQTGSNIRLPTEAEWEYACSSGEKKEVWAGTNSESSLADYAWYYGHAGRKTHPVHPVGQKKPNRFGLYDMSGNVREWTSSTYEGVEKYIRGGSSNDFSERLKCSHDPGVPSTMDTFDALRDIERYEARQGFQGFRCARTLR